MRLEMDSAQSAREPPSRCRPRYTTSKPLYISGLLEYFMFYV